MASYSIGDGHTQERNVVEIYRPEEWRVDRRHTYFDLAIIHLDMDFTHTRYVLPVSLPPYEFMSPPEDAILQVAGWQFANEKQKTYYQTPFLQTFDLHVITQRGCNSAYHDKYGDSVIYVFSSMCALDHSKVAGGNPGKTCFWDRGAPAVTKDEGTDVFYLAGLYGWTDFEEGCNTKPYPAHFTRISGHLGWIRENSFPPVENQ